MKLGKVVGLFSSVSGVVSTAEAVGEIPRADEHLFEGEMPKQATQKVAVQLKRRIEEMRVEPKWLGKYSGYRNLSMK